MTLKTSLLVTLAMLTSSMTYALPADVSTKVTAVMPKVVTWRRDFHEHPELSNQEFRTAKIVADHLRALGMEVETEVAHTGVVGTWLRSEQTWTLSRSQKWSTSPLRQRQEASIRVVMLELCTPVGTTTMLRF